MELTRLWHWQKFFPNVGNNLELREQDQLYLEVAVGLSKVELKRLSEAIGDLEGLTFEAGAKQLADAWRPFVRLAPGAHTLEGKPLASIDDYIGAVITQPGLFNLMELSAEAGRLNSIRGTQALFSQRLAGGGASTSKPSTAKT